MEEDQHYSDPFQSLSEHDARDDVPFLKDPYNEDSFFSLDAYNLKVTPKEEDTIIFPNLVCEQLKQQVSTLLKMQTFEYAAHGRKNIVLKH